MNVAAYCRVSTDKEDQKNSFESQKKYFDEFINRHQEWHLVNIYTDEGITGTNVFKRDGFNQMIKDAKMGKIDLILTKEVSRFARNTIDTLYFTRELKKYTVGVYFINDNINTLDNDGELRLTIMASLAQEESRKISERVKWGVTRKMESGFVYSPNLLGYDVHKGNITINEDGAKTIRRIFNMFAYEGKSANQIAKILTCEGVPTLRQTYKWYSKTIISILRNEKYVGDLLQRKMVVANYLDHKLVVNEDDSTKVFHANHHEPIISRNTWDKVQNILNESINASRFRSNAIPFKPSNRYWGSGKIICGCCGRNYSATIKKRKNTQDLLIWRCIEAMHYGRKKETDAGITVGCDNKQIADRAIRACILFALKQLNIQKDAIKAQAKKKIKKLKNVQNGNDIDVIKNNLMTKLKNIQTKRNRLVDLYLEGTINKSEMLDNKNLYNNQLSKIQQEIDEVENAKITVEEIEEQIAKINSRIDTIVSENQFNQNIFCNVVQHLIIHPNNTLEIFFFHIPKPIKVKFLTSGRGDKYTIKCDFAT